MDFTVVMLLFSFLFFRATHTLFIAGNVHSRCHSALSPWQIRPAATRQISTNAPQARQSTSHRSLRRFLNPKSSETAIPVAGGPAPNRLPLSRSSKHCRPPNALAKQKQRRLRITQGLDLTTHHLGQMLKGRFYFPTRSVPSLQSPPPRPSRWASSSESLSRFLRLAWLDPIGSSHARRTHIDCPW